MLRGEILQTPVADLSGTKIMGTVTELSIRDDEAKVEGLVIRLRSAGRRPAFVPLEAIESLGRTVILFAGQAQRIRTYRRLDSAGIMDLQGAFYGMAQDLDFDPVNGVIHALWIRRWALGPRIQLPVPDPSCLRRTGDGTFLLTQDCDPNLSGR